MPETNAAITITVVVPTTTPRMVRNERSLFCQSVSNAIQMFSRKSLRVISSSYLFFLCMPGLFLLRLSSDSRIAVQDHLTSPQHLFFKIHRVRGNMKPGTFADLLSLGVTR